MRFIGAGTIGVAAIWTLAKLVKPLVSGLAGAFDGDLVEIAPLRAGASKGRRVADDDGDMTGRPAARVLSVVDRAHDTLVGRYEVSAPSLASPARVLSGGNLQKLMLARELSDEPRVVLAMQPTWGLDVGATRFVHDRLRAERDRGGAVLLVSEDLDELLQLADRLAVVYQGRVMGVLEDPRGCSQESIGLMMAGADPSVCGGGAA